MTTSISSVAPPTRRWPFILSLAILVALFVLGLVVYPSVPDPMPTHWNVALQPDSWAPRSFGLFLTPVWIGFGLVVMMWIVAGVAPAAQRLADPAAEDGADGSESQVHRQLSPRPRGGQSGILASIRLLEHLVIACVVLIGLMAAVAWLGAPEPFGPWVPPVLLAAFLVVLIVDSVRVVRASRAPGPTLDGA